MKKKDPEQILDDIKKLGLGEKPVNALTAEDIAAINARYESHNYKSSDLTFSRIANVQDTDILLAMAQRDGKACYAAGFLLLILCSTVMQANLVQISYDSIMKHTGFQRATISRSLKVLESYRLIKCIQPGRRGKPAIYAINGAFCKIGKSKPYWTDKSILYSDDDKLAYKIRTIKTQLQNTLEDVQTSYIELIERKKAARDTSTGSPQP